MFNEYYAKQEQYKALLKEAEKERLISQIKKSQKESQLKSAQDAEWAPRNLLEKLSSIFKEAPEISPEMPK